MVARSSLLRRLTPGARPARRISSVVAALAALAPRLVRLAHHDYPDRLLAQENDEVPAQEVGLVLDRGAAARCHQHVEQLAVARLLARGGVLVQRVQYLVDDARDLALRDHQVAAAEGAAPVRCVGAEDVEDALGDAAIAPHAGYRRQ